MHKCLRWLGFIVALVSIIAIITNFALTAARDGDTGGLKWPYISDTAKEAPQYYILAIGMSISAVALFVSVIYYGRLLRHIATTTRHKRSVVAAVVFGTISAFGLAFLAIFDTKRYPSLHLVFAILFFVCSMVSITAMFTVFAKLVASHEDLACLQTSRSVKIVIVTLMWLCFVIYLPIGLPIADYSQLPDGNWDYTSDIPTNTMRTVTQFFTVITMLAYYATWPWDLVVLVAAQKDLSADVV
eukprot:m.90785 g.90785  ORF g.90785 m.90785 type:complete len:243 (-) comp12926_c0_seq4:586-1314(-)